MTTGRAFPVGPGRLILAGDSHTAGTFRETRRQSDSRSFEKGHPDSDKRGPPEYAVAGEDPPLMMIHGTGGGFDQGLLLAAGLRPSGLRIVTPSRFGHLGSARPGEAAAARQADRIPGARLIVYPDGGHIRLGHDADLSRVFDAFTTGIPIA